ncbi:class I SAM-dependent methyltransferase [Marinoscillum sp. MHG1-6]|uniref:class I SAM-dependent methyltransferase n=1 Tax=Marinoscillum sp. MHG1-6 TaxID=2959627 RepID=UPI002157F1E3|nr:class I SAM-dependent methyltransferase [Marinoscillum sp. MHG1-6]
MGLYDKYILPKVIDWTCQQRPNMKQREKVVPLAYGNVLEIGIGSGLNLPFYDQEKVKSLIGVDPAEEIWRENEVDAHSLPFEFHFIKAYAEHTPIDNHSIDSAVVTYSLCSIPNLAATFEELKRVMKPNGTLIFCEHGKAPDKAVEKWQNLINPVWKRLGGGCNLNRDIPEIIKANGFKINHLDTMYIPGWKPACFNYWGSATVN